MTDTLQKNAARASLLSAELVQGGPFGRMVLREGDVRLMRSRGPGNYQYDWQAVQRNYDEGHTYRECSAFRLWSRLMDRRPPAWSVTLTRTRSAGMATSRPSTVQIDR